MNLAPETFYAASRCHLGRENLENDLTSELQIFCEKDTTHPATTKLSLDQVHLRERFLQFFAQRVSQVGASRAQKTNPLLK